MIFLREGGKSVKGGIYTRVSTKEERQVEVDIDETTHLFAEGTAEPDHGDPAETASIRLHDGIDEVSGPDGHAEDVLRVDIGLLQHALDDVLYTAGDIWRGRGLAGGQDTARGSLTGRDIEDGGVSVGPTNVHANTIHDVLREVVMGVEKRIKKKGREAGVRL